MKRSKNKKRIVIVLIILIILILISLPFISINLINTKHRKQVIEFKNNMDLIKKEDVSYAVVEINPKTILKIVDNKVVNKRCLNEDCETIFGNIDVLNKSLLEVIELLYNTSKDNGINVTNGVNLSITDDKMKDEIINLGYVIYNFVSTEDIKQYLEEDEIKNIKSDNEEIFEMLKKDSDYGKLFICNNNEQLSCYITDEFEKEISSANSMVQFFVTAPKLVKVFNKFNIEYDYTDNYGFINISAINIPSGYYRIGVDYVRASSYIGKVGDTIPESKEERFENAFVEIIPDKALLPLNKFDLYNKTYNEKDLFYFTI